MSKLWFIRFVLLPFSWIYGIVLTVRNLCFDFGIFKVTKFNVTIVAIGNLTVGGTGKTPHVKWFVNHFKKEKQCAIVLRGYGRKTKGFHLVQASSSHADVGDEALLYFNHFGEQIKIAVCEDRVEGVRQLLALFPNIELIFLDDAYQHRKIHRDVNILLTDFYRPFWKDFVLPAGRLREFRLGKNRADIIIVTKSPQEISNEERIKIVRKINASNQQLVTFSKVNYGEIIPLFSEEWKEVNHVLLVTGIAYPKPLEVYLSQKYTVKSLTFSDHYDFTTTDIQQIHDIFDTFVKEDKAIITTEKDRMRLKEKLASLELTHTPWFYQSISVVIEDEKTCLERIENIC